MRNFTYKVNVLKIDSASKVISFDNTFNGECIVEAENAQDAMKKAIAHVSVKKHVPEHLLWTTASDVALFDASKSYANSSVCTIFSAESLAAALVPANVCRNAKFLENDWLMFEVFNGVVWNKMFVAKDEYEQKLDKKCLMTFNTENGQACIMSR